jgi:hypothetical protein
MRVINALALATLLLATAGGTSMAQDKPADTTASLAVGPQYDTAHVYVAPKDVDRFSDSVIATFGGRDGPISDIDHRWRLNQRGS